MLYAYASDFITAKTTYCFPIPVPSRVRKFQLLDFPRYAVITTVSRQVLASVPSLVLVRFRNGWLGRADGCRLLTNCFR